VDLKALSKADREAARDAMNPARAARKASAAEDPGKWTPPVLQTIASKSEGVAETVDAIDRHFRYLANSGVLRDRRRARLRDRVVEVSELLLRRRLWSNPETQRGLDERLDAMERGEMSPYAAARDLIVEAGETLTRMDG
jgi:LAO/AO transport system kinase